MIMLGRVQEPWWQKPEPLKFKALLWWQSCLCGDLGSQTYWGCWHC